MQELKEAFIAKNHELEFNEFVQVVWKFMNVQKGEESTVILALLQFFQDIDINDDKKMQWSEFSDFLAESQRHSADQEVDLDEYEMDTLKAPFSIRGGTVHQLKYSKRNDVIAVLMENSKQLTIVDHHKNDIVHTIKGHRCYIICCEFLDAFQLNVNQSNQADERNASKKKNMNMMHKRSSSIVVATSGLDEMIHIWALTQNTKFPIRLRSISVNCVHNMLYWSDERKWLVSADMEYNVYVWDQRIERVVWRNRLHSDVIVDVLLPANTSLFISASLDCTVVAYDLSAQRVKFKLDNVHKHGLVSVAYKSSLHMLVTAAAEHKLAVSDSMGRLLATLSGHVAPVVSMISAPDSSAVVSLDCSNTFKLWDIRKMECIQSLHFASPMRPISNMVCMAPNHAMIALGSSGIHYLSRRRSMAECTGLQLRERDNMCIAIFVLESKAMLLTVHETIVQKWDLSTGRMLKLIRILPHILGDTHTITCCQVSATQKLLLVGSSNGFVAVISIYSGGLVMLCQPKHPCSVAFVGFYKSMIISLDVCGTIFKYDGFRNWMVSNSAKSHGHERLPRSLLMDIASPAHIAVIHHGFGLLIIGTENGLLRFVCLASGKSILHVNSHSIGDADTADNTLHEEHDAITCMRLQQEGQQQLLFTTDKCGNIRCWRLPEQYPAKQAFFCQCMYRIRNNVDDLTGTPVATFCVRKFADFLVTGDSNGFIKLWNVSACNNVYLMKKWYVTSDWVNDLLIVTDSVMRNTFESADKSESEMPLNQKRSSGNVLLCIISSSVNGKLFAWKLNGQCIGELSNGKSETPWCVPVDIDRKQSKQLAYAYQLFRKMKL